MSGSGFKDASGAFITAQTGSPSRGTTAGAAAAGGRPGRAHFPMAETPHSHRPPRVGDVVDGAAAGGGGGSGGPGEVATHSGGGGTGSGAAFSPVVFGGGGGGAMSMRTNSTSAGTSGDPTGTGTRTRTPTDSGVTASVSNGSSDVSGGGGGSGLGGAAAAGRDTAAQSPYGPGSGQGHRHHNDASTAPPPPHAPDGLPPDFFLDERAEMARHPFPIPPAELIAKARQVLAVGVHRWPDLADDFEFSAPFIGPLGPAAFRSTLDTLSLEEAFPDLAPRYHHFRVDPFRPNRVWVSLQPHCTHTGPFKGNLPFAVKPTGRVIEEPPQTCSLSFSAAGQVSGYTMGYVMDRRVGTTSGLGGAFGLMWALGAPLAAPEGRPWSPSLRLKAVNSGNWVVQAAAYLYDRAASLVLPASWMTRRSRNNM